jgi:predicted LPLAT superfamily acyltransferase
MSDAKPGWAAAQERGNPFWSGVALLLVQRLGWRFGRGLLWPITAWFLATSPGARAASHEYLGLALGRSARFTDVARHFHAFAASILDAAFFLSRRTQDFTVEVSGQEHLAALAAQGRGCILLGGHLGGIEVLRHAGRGSSVPVRPLMHRRNAPGMIALLDRLDPGLTQAIILLGEPDSMLRAREAIQRGEIIGILGDRAVAGDRHVAVPFLGRDAGFPTGPIIVAALLGAPVLFVRGVCTGPRRYEVRFEPFAERIVLRREHRAEDLREAVARFARSLETACLAHPTQWFNFYPFWKHSTDAVDHPSARDPAGHAAGGPGPGSSSGSGPGPRHRVGGAVHLDPAGPQPGRRA